MAGAESIATSFVLVFYIGAIVSLVCALLSCHVWSRRLFTWMCTRKTAGEDIEGRKVTRKDGEEGEEGEEGNLQSGGCMRWLPAVITCGYCCGAHKASPIQKVQFSQDEPTIAISMPLLKL